MRLIDADVAIKDANLNYGGVYDAVLVKHFLDKQPTVDINNSDGCDFCNSEHCSTCIYAVGCDYYPCRECDWSSRKYEPYNYCPHCGKRLRKG